MDFLGVTLDSTLSWQGHISKMIKKLNSACFAIRSLKVLLTIDDLKTVYFAYVHSVITYGITFWGNATNSKNVLIIQKRMIRIIMSVNAKASVHISLLLLVVKNMHLFVLNTEVHIINTQQSINLHVPSIKLAKCKNGFYYMGIVIFNHLPCNLWELSSDYIKFKSGIKKFTFKPILLFNK
jgi:hypothetical protein